MKKIYYVLTLFTLVFSNNVFAIQEENLISSYCTKIQGSENKIHNIQLACYSIDETIIYPEGIFSYNDALGPTTLENGYKLGKIFIEGEEVDGVGGGVCQVSSTLYNAVLGANLDIIERNEHSKEVTYVPKGYDAATSYGGIDFQFLNNLENPIRIDSFIFGDLIYTNIYSL